MAKKTVKRKLPLGSKSITQLIESGESLNGLHAYVRFDDSLPSGDPIFVPIIIEGFTVRSNTCGINIKVRCQGLGIVDEPSFYIDPCSIYMSKEEVDLTLAREKTLLEHQCRIELITRFNTKAKRFEQMKSIASDLGFLEKFDALVTESGKSYAGDAFKDCYKEHFNISEKDTEAIFGYRFNSI